MLSFHFHSFPATQQPETSQNFVGSHECLWTNTGLSEASTSNSTSKQNTKTNAKHCLNVRELSVTITIRQLVQRQVWWFHSNILFFHYIFRQAVRPCLISVRAINQCLSFCSSRKLNSTWHDIHKGAGFIQCEHWAPCWSFQIIWSTMRQQLWCII